MQNNPGNRRLWDETTAREAGGGGRRAPSWGAAGWRVVGCFVSLSGPFARRCGARGPLPHHVVPPGVSGAGSCGTARWSLTCGSFPTARPGPRVSATSRSGGLGSSEIRSRFGALPKEAPRASCQPGGCMTHFPEGVLPPRASGPRGLTRRLTPGWPAVAPPRVGLGRGWDQPAR